MEGSLIAVLPALETFQHDLPARLAALQQGVGALEVGCLDAPEVFVKCRAKFAGIDQPLRDDRRACRP
jgi:hypothetical protein